MAHITEVKFGDLQMDERYKKLERTLKLASLRKGNRKGDESWPLPTSPSISSINVDPSDSSIPCLQTSRIGSVVVSSSNNLKDILLKRKDFNSDHKRIATSSVRKFNKESDCSNDRLIMPPPKFDNVHHRSKKSNGVVTYNVAKSSTISQNECNSYGIDNESPKKKQDYKFSNNSGKYTENLSSVQINTDNTHNRKIRIFRKWKVMLNEQCQLVIKGTLQCGQVARSKPVVRRLTSTSVESIFKHVYQLQGNIVDDEYELPDYVRGKFLSGFPDDWENVYQVWRTFVQQGCIVTFRWPTPIADSDDDLKSEVTDVTFACSKSPKDETLNSYSLKRSHLSAFKPECTYNVLQTRNQQNCSPQSSKKSDSFTQTCISDMIESAFEKDGNIQILRNRFSNNKENYNEQGTKDVNYSHVKSKASTLKDKLNGIVNNLTDKNCPQECITKIIEIFDCLNYVVLHRSVKDDDSNTEGTKTECENSMMQVQSKAVRDISQDYLENEIVPLKSSTGNQIVNYDTLMRRKRSFTEMNKDSNCSTSDSESEIYAGVPKVPIERILRQKQTLIKPRKRKIRKKIAPSTRDTDENKCTSKISLIPSDYTNKSYTSAITSEKINGINFNDSSVSVIEDERHNLTNERYIPSNVQDNNNFDEHMESDIDLEKWKWKESFNHSKNKNLREMQEHFVKEKVAIPIHEPTAVRYDFYDEVKQNERDIVVKKKVENKVPGMSLREIGNDSGRESENVNNQCQSRLSCQQSEDRSSSLKNTTSKRAKPVVISSVPVDINITNLGQIKEQKEARSEEKINKNTNKESKRQSSEQAKSPKKHSEELDKVQLSSINYSPKKTLRDNLQVFRNNKFADNNKPKLLSAWTPIVLSEPELHLIFEGKLLNEAGHVVLRKCKTDIVRRRISPKLIETINHEIFQLVGDLNDTKHVVPKELLNHCRFGCPVRIEQFCRTWISLQPVSPEKLNDTSIDTINVRVSSKGRRIIPPLSYWTGERITLKDNNPVYNPGTSQDTTIASIYDNCPKSNQGKSTKQRRRDKKKRSTSTSQSSPEKLVNESKNRTTKIGKNKSKESASKSKRNLPESSGSSDDSLHKRKKTKAGQQKAVSSTNGAKRRTARLITAENSPESYTDVDITELPARTKTRGSKKVTTPHTSPSKQMPGNHQLSARKYRDVVCTYYQDIPVEDGVLSDDQVSHV